MKEKIHALLVGELLDGESVAQDESLFKAGLLDSVDLVQLVSLLEETFDIRISPRDITPQNFDTIELMSAFVSSRMTGE